SHAEICVEDNGIGIDPQFLPHVFDRFRQGDSGITRRFGGLGLGLSIVKNLIELHGGSVRVKSPGADQGSSFIISLPISLVRSDHLAETRTQNGAASAEAVELPRLDEIRVLVVDDEEDGRHLIARILENRGAQVACVSSATAAIQALSEGHFDVLLSDIGMPDMDGYQLIRKVKQLDDARSRPIPAIAITAYARSEERQRSLLAGFHMHLSKPVEARELVASIAGLLHLSH
ncbi:MAG: response regulator, partial [Sinobacteraceae bacterium]|nr:response regulator [Nevskiaceae bacterium]